MEEVAAAAAMKVQRIPWSFRQLTYLIHRITSKRVRMDHRTRKNMVEGRRWHLVLINL